MDKPVSKTSSCKTCWHCSTKPAFSRFFVSLMFSFSSILAAISLTSLNKMENFDDYENKSYAEARRLKYRLRDYLGFLLNTIVIVMNILGVLIVDLLINLFKLFKPAKPKDVSGQLALVTG